MVAADPEAPAGQVFYVHCKGAEIKLTLAAKALSKPFVKKIVEPALKAFNAKLPKDEQLELQSRLAAARSLWMEAPLHPYVP